MVVCEGGYENQGQEQARFTRWQALLRAHPWHLKVCPLRQINEFKTATVSRHMLT